MREALVVPLSTRSPSPGPARDSIIYEHRGGLRAGIPPNPTSEEFVMSEVVVVIGAGSIGQAVARRVSAGKHVVLADLRDDNAAAAAEVMLDAGFEVSTATVDVSSRE